MDLVYNIPRLIDINAHSKLFKNKKKLLIIGRCLEVVYIVHNFIGWLKKSSRSWVFANK